jgi:hypoxanthine phosphoribosyltransferase
MTPAMEAAKTFAAAELLYSEDQVRIAVKALAAKVAQHTVGENLLVLCVMNGGLITTGLLIPHLPNMLRVDYLHATRYRGQIHGDKLHWAAEPRHSLAGQNVLVVDDIFDEGHTLKAICDHCRLRGARKIYSAVLVNKLHDRKPETFTPSFSGLDVPDRYVFGCGMDYKGYLRNLPNIYAVAA